jgi:hypothetical protein
MLSNRVPVKTEQGQAELAQRSRRLSQRHRTVLLLVDGRRTVAQVVQMAAGAGVPAECFDELVALGLVAAADGAELPAVAGGESRAAEGDSLLPPLRSLLPESAPGELDETPREPVDPQESVPATGDARLEEARELLSRALRNEAPVSGALTLMKVRRAASRDELDVLIDEVEQRLRKPRRQLMTKHLIRQVRHLLTLP